MSPGTEKERSKELKSITGASLAVWRSLALRDVRFGFKFVIFGFQCSVDAEVKLGRRTASCFWSREVPLSGAPAAGAGAAAVRVLCHQVSPGATAGLGVPGKRGGTCG